MLLVHFQLRLPIVNQFVTVAMKFTTKSVQAVNDHVIIQEEKDVDRIFVLLVATAHQDMYAMEWAGVFLKLAVHVHVRDYTL